MKVSFRRVAEKDLKRLNEIVNDREVAKFITLTPPVPLKETRRFFNRCRKEKIRWYAILADDVVAGSVSLHPQKGLKQAHVASFGISLAKEFWGRGIGGRALAFITEKARTLSIKRLELQVVADNARALKLYESNGFQKEGIRRKSFKLGKKYHNNIIMAKLL
jgi:RimJ/RimL family protein N-acetyltransferase